MGDRHKTNTIKGQWIGCILHNRDKKDARDLSLIGLNKEKTI